MTCLRARKALLRVVRDHDTDQYPVLVVPVDWTTDRLAEYVRSVHEPLGHTVTIIDWGAPDLWLSGSCRVSRLQDRSARMSHLCPTKLKCTGYGISHSDGYCTGCQQCSDRRSGRLLRGALFSPTGYAGEAICNTTGRIVAHQWEAA